MIALAMKDGKEKWSYQTGGSIFSSPSYSQRSIVFGSGDGNVYSLSRTGKLIWKKETGASVLGSPIINGDTVFIGSSDHSFYALDLVTGKTPWQFGQLEGPVVSTPLLCNNNVIFGAWDK